ncbi:MAG TPA: DUF5320 domain-containing protein [Methanothrix sp.]|nr:DUF5320 domain-containing protein [Methanothrix sp.]
MPWGDRTGHGWIGSRAGYYNPCSRRAYGSGAGYGSGLIRHFGFPPTPEEERSYLETVARDLENDLKSVRDQIERLQSGS